MRFFLTLLLIGINLCGCSSVSDSENLTKKNNKIALINIQLGTGYLAQGNPERAKQKLLYALEKAPQLPEAWYSMGYYMEATGNSIAAKDYYLKAILLNPKRGDVQNNYGTYLCRTGHYNESIEHFVVALQDPQYIQSASAYENAGLCALKIPNRSLAAKYFAKAIAENPDMPVSIGELQKLKKV